MNEKEEAIQGLKIAAIFIAIGLLGMLILNLIHQL